uniref:Uncharacterized protein n=1 Tax=Romanomermis culicivorax TaxID=13658 RepID=A0A915J8F7_ROMCU
MKHMVTYSSEKNDMQYLSNQLKSRDWLSLQIVIKQYAYELSSMAKTLTRFRQRIENSPEAL